MQGPGLRVKVTQRAQGGSQEERPGPGATVGPARRLGRLKSAQLVIPALPRLSSGGLAQVPLSVFVPWDVKESGEMSRVAADPTGHTTSHLVWAAVLLMP